MNIGPFFDASIRPPRGGWHYPVGGAALGTFYSENEVLEAMEKWERNQPNPRTEAQLRQALWAYYCEREPHRCGGKPENPGAKVSAGVYLPLEPSEITKEMQGPPIWLFLNTLAAVWTPGLHHYFLATVDAIGAMLVCAKCQQEWRSLRREIPPEPLASRFAVCQWVNTVHNRVNAKAGKPHFPYTEMVVKFGAPTK